MKTTKATVFKVDYNELDKHINKFFKKKKIDIDYQCIPYEVWFNDEEHYFDVDGNVTDEEIEDLKDGNVEYCLQEILDWMCKEKVINAGEYIVEVYW